MGERYSEAEIRAQIHNVLLGKRIELMSRVLETIDIQGILIPHRDEMTSTLVTEGLTFKWCAWRISAEKTIPYLVNGGFEQYKTHWWPHAPYLPEPHKKRLGKRYDKYLDKYQNDPIIRGIFSTAVIIACMQKEQELLIS